MINRRTSGANITYVNHTREVDFTASGSLHNTGYRFSKYQFSHTAPNCCSYSSVDLVLYRRWNTKLCESMRWYHPDQCKLHGSSRFIRNFRAGTEEGTGRAGDLVTFWITNVQGWSNFWPPFFIGRHAPNPDRGRHARPSAHGVSCQLERNSSNLNIFATIPYCSKSIFGGRK